jgi:hypothetical protein
MPAELTTGAPVQQALALGTIVVPERPVPEFRYCGFEYCDLVVGYRGDPPGYATRKKWCSRHNTPEKRAEAYLGGGATDAVR